LSKTSQIIFITFPQRYHGLVTITHNATLQCILTLWRLVAFGDFQEKKHQNARGFAREFLWSCKR